MKKIAIAALALALLNGAAAIAQQDNENPKEPGQNRNQQDRKDQKQNRVAPATPAAPARREERPATPVTAPTQEPNRTREVPAQKSEDRNRSRVVPAAPMDRGQKGEAPALPASRSQSRDRSTPAAPIVQEQNRTRLPAAAPDQNGVRAPLTNSQDTERSRDVRTQTQVLPTTTRWSKGDRLPEEFRRSQQFTVSDWRQRGLRQPPRGYYWVRNDTDDFFLAALATGMIAEALYRDEWSARWSRRYSRSYTYNDDGYYQECRNSSDPAGVFAGALIGGLLGNAARQSGGATIAGVIVGGMVGAALTKNLNCDDRSYAYKTYYDGLNAGRPGRRYYWRNPSNDHRGDFRITSYYNDSYNFRCARYTQTVYIAGRQQQARGVACRQLDGIWAIVS